MQKIYNAVSVIIPSDKGYLMVQERASRLWGPPSGRIEEKETPMSAATRETKEETGLIITLDGFIGNYIFTNRNNYRINCTVFRASRDFQGEVNPQDRDISEARFMSVEEIKKLYGKNLLRSGEATIKCLSDYLSRGFYPIREIFNEL